MTDRHAAQESAEPRSSDYFETVDCPFCGSATHRPATGLTCDGAEHHVAEPYRSMQFRMVRCGECGLRYQRERLRPEALNAFYPDDYFCYQSFASRGAIIRNLALLTARSEVRRIERWRPPGQGVFVDFGCGNGSWLELFRAAGAPWEMYGTEISAGNVDHIRQLGFRGYQCDEHTIERHFAPGSVGVIFMHHVIEHVASPLQMLAAFHRVLAPGGIIVGQTPDAGSLECRLFGDHWLQWHLPQHLVVFDQPSLRRHAERAGFEVVRLKSSLSGATQWSGALLKMAAARRGRVFRWTSEPLHPYLTLLFAPVAAVQCLFNNSSHLDFMLRKPGP